MEYTVDNGHTNLKAPVDLSATFRSNCRLMHGNTGAREVKGEFRNRATKFGKRLCLRRTHASSRGCGNTYGGEHCGAHDGARAPKHWPLAHHLDAILRAQDDPTRSGGALNLALSYEYVRPLVDVTRCCYGMPTFGQRGINPIPNALRVFRGEFDSG